MTPLQYAERYKNLFIPVNDSFEKIQLRKYRSKIPGADKDQLLGKVWGLFSKGRTVEVKVPTPSYVEHKTYRNKDEIAGAFARPFYGKGAPEECALVLQLAALTKHVPRERLQHYSDENLGIDCNGFVGNYLWHAANGARWDQTAGKQNKGPSTLINELVRPPFLKSMDDILPGKLYVLGLVDKNGNVIPGGGVADSTGEKRAGHIMINDPTGFRMDIGPAYWAGGCYEGDDPKAPKAVKSLRVVESTGSLGLVDSWYGLIKVEKGIFTVWRGCKKGLMKVRICAA